MKSILSKIIGLIVLLLVISCNNDTQQQPQAKQESVNEGKIIVYVDSTLMDLIKPTIEFYKESFPKIEPNINYVNSRKAVSMLFAGEAEAIVIGREYLPDEDSLNKEYNLNRPEMIFAKDGLVFFTHSDFPLDTMNDEQIYSALTQNKNFKDFYKNLQQEPELVTTDQNNSLYPNLVRLAARNQKITKNIKIVSNNTELLNYVKNNKNAIGIGFLSFLFNKIDYKMLRISFLNKEGTRIPPQVVHQGFIVQNKYPYIVNLKVILREEMRNKAFWFASYLSKEAIVQKYFLNSGIVPEYAKFALTPSENIIK